MKYLCLLLLLIAIETKAQPSQKVWKTFTCNNTTYRLIRISYNHSSAESDSIVIQQLNKGKWITDASYYMPSEGAKYKDVNNDGFIDISLQMRFGQIVFLYNNKQKKYVEMGEVSYEGFEKITSDKNTWFTFIQYKKTHEWWAQIFTIVNSKKVVLLELIATPNESENDDDFDTAYGSITYKRFDKNAFIQEVFSQQQIAEFLKQQDDVFATCKKWLTNKYAAFKK